MVNLGGPYPASNNPQAIREAFNQHIQDHPAGGGAGAVSSVFTRTGDVVAAEGDYSLDQLSDVVITTPIDNDLLRHNGTNWVNEAVTIGDVVGAASSTDNAAARMNGTGGKTIQNSGVIIDDSDNVTGVTTLNIDGTGDSLVVDTTLLVVDATNDVVMINTATQVTGTGNPILQTSSATAGKSGLLVGYGQTAKGRLFNAAPTSAGRLELSVNAYFDGTNWQRDNTGVEGGLFLFNANTFTYNQAASGANPITFTEAFGISSTDIRFNDSSADLNFRVESNNDAEAFYIDGGTDDVGFSTQTPTGQVEIEAFSTTHAVALLVLDQQDADQQFIDYVGTSAANTTNNITTFTTGGAIQGFIRINVNTVDYWMPFYTAPTA